MVVTESGMVTVFTAVFFTPHFPHEDIPIVMVPSGMLKCPSALTLRAAIKQSQDAYCVHEYAQLQA